MNFGFVIDNRSCIGCHACSTACKSENDVPLGVHRTWVKTVETGRFPDSRRHFQVTRCNHCANPPCVRICPTGAMYKRDDGIVEFDHSICIGCKGCMQACPYDAIHMDPDSGTAAKCHYCSHRVEVGREPACVVVCPEHAIIAGDMDDPQSEISRVLAKEQVTVRKPEKGTSPNLFYIEGQDFVLTPSAASAVGGMLAVERISGNDHQQLPQTTAGHMPLANGVAPSGPPDAGPIMIGEGRMAEQMVQMSYNVQHKVPWHWQVPAYLVTKGISSGLFLVLASAWLLDVGSSSAVSLISSVVAMAMLALTGIFLIWDLDRPERFYLILLRPQWRSWLARGAVVITAFGAVLGTWLALEAGLAMSWLQPDLIARLMPPTFLIGIPVSVITAIYTAFLFRQAEGRDLWQSSLLPLHLLVQSLLAGAASLLIIGAFVDLGSDLADLTRQALIAMIVVDLLVVLVGEVGMTHASEVATQAAYQITHGQYAKMFWGGAIILGHALPLAMLSIGIGAGLAGLAGLFTLIGLYLYEHAFVMAPQNIPNS